METGVRHARLPIGTYLADLPTRKVLTVNQVVEILLHWNKSRDWEEALYSIVPKRKFKRPEDNQKEKTTEVVVGEPGQEEIHPRPGRQIARPGVHVLRARVRARP